MSFFYTREHGDQGRILVGEGDVPGEALSRMLGRGPMPVRAALELISYVADVLTIAEEDEEVHGDLKPGFVHIDSSAAVHVGGYGQSRKGGRAPEGRSQNVDTDVYGMGLILLSALTADSIGAIPRDRDDHDDLIVSKLKQVDWQELADRSWQEQVLHFMCSMLSYRPEERPQALDVANILGHVAAQLEGESLRRWADSEVDRTTDSVPVPVVSEELSGAHSLKSEGPSPTASTRNFRQAASSKGESTAFWTREKIAEMLEDESDVTPDARRYEAPRPPEIPKPERMPPELPELPDATTPATQSTWESVRQEQRSTQNAVRGVGNVPDETPAEDPSFHSRPTLEKLRGPSGSIGAPKDAPSPPIARERPRSEPSRPVAREPAPTARQSTPARDLPPPPPPPPPPPNDGAVAARPTELPSKARAAVLKQLTPARIKMALGLMLGLGLILFLAIPLKGFVEDQMSRSDRSRSDDDDDDRDEDDDGGGEESESSDEDPNKDPETESESEGSGSETDPENSTSGEEVGEVRNDAPESESGSSTRGTAEGRYDSEEETRSTSADDDPEFYNPVEIARVELSFQGGRAAYFCTPGVLEGEFNLRTEFELDAAEHGNVGDSTTCIIQAGSGFRVRGVGEYRGAFTVTGMGPHRVNCQMDPEDASQTRMTCTVAD